MRTVHEIRYGDGKRPARNVFSGEHTLYVVSESLDFMSDSDTFARIFAARLIPLAQDHAVSLSERAEIVKGDFDKFKRDMRPKLRNSSGLASVIRGRALDDLSLVYVNKYVEDKIDEAKCSNLPPAQGYCDVQQLLRSATSM